MPHPELFQRTAAEIVTFVGGETNLETVWINPNRRTGLACVAGSRLSVGEVASYWLDTRDDSGLVELVEDFEVSIEEVRVAVAAAYAFVAHVENEYHIDFHSRRFPEAPTALDLNPLQLVDPLTLLPGAALDEFETTLGAVTVHISGDGKVTSLLGSTGSEIQTVCLGWRSGNRHLEGSTAQDVDQVLAFHSAALAHCNRTFSLDVQALLA